jgi:NADPH2:quinone reductase
MQAWLIDGYDGIDKLRRADVPDPVPAEGEVILRVQLAALNPADYYLAQGQYPAKPRFPHILGRDCIGLVEALGPGVKGVRTGDQRIILRGDTGVDLPGTFAQRVAAPAVRLVEKPAGWSDEEACGASLVYLTAWQALLQFGHLAPKQVVLVTGASGGVGTATLQLAKALGHRVVALSRSEEKRARLAEMGADITLDPSAPELGKRVKSALAGDRVDLVVDQVGGSDFNEILGTMGMNGRISVVGRLAGPVPSFNTASLFFRRIHVRGVGVYTYTADEAREAWGQIVGTLGRTGARPLVDRVFGFEELPAAFARLQAGPTGKVCLRVGS